MIEVILAILGALAAGIAIYEFWLKRVLKKPEKSEEETRTTLTELKEEVTSIKTAVGEMRDYLDGIPKTKNIKFKKLFDIGYDLYEKCKYTEAVDVFNKCLKLDIKDSERGALLILLGNALSSLGEIKDAETRYNEALLLTQRINDDEGKAAALGNIGLIYSDKGVLDVALKYHKDALEIDKEIGYRQGEASALNNIATVSFEKGDLTHTLTYLKEALAIYEKIGAKREIEMVKGNIERVKKLIEQKDKR